MKYLLILLALSTQVHALSLQDEDCLVRTVYAEARGEGITGALLVSDVIIERAERDNKTICEIVHKRRQFKVHKAPVPDEFKANFKIWRCCFRQLVPQHFAGATYFHSIKKENPWWAKKFTRLGRWGNHVFYRSDERTASAVVDPVLLALRSNDRFCGRADYSCLSGNFSGYCEIQQTYRSS